MHRKHLIKRSSHAGPAYLKLIEAAKAEQGQLTLVVLGPLTNVALACKLDSQLPTRGEPSICMSEDIMVK